MVNARELDVLLAKAMNAHQAGQIAEAQISYKALLKTIPRHYVAMHFLGLSYLQQGKLDKGIAFVQKALAIKPDYADAHYNLGTALQGRKRFDEAVVHYRKALAIDPNNANTHNNLGALLLELKRYEEAITHFVKALSINPCYAESHSNIATALKELQRYEEAITHYANALAINPTNAEIHCNLGTTLQALNRYEDALAAFDQALTRKVDLAEAWLGRGHVLNALKRHDEALAAYDKALMQNPHLEWAQGHRLFVKMLNCDWRNFRAESARLVADVRNGTPVATPFMLLVVPSSSADQQKCAQLAVQRRHPGSKSPLWRGDRYSHDQIRIAYLSADFRDHPVARVMAGLFEHHDRKRFEVTAISFGIDDGGAMRARLVKAFDRFVEVRMKSDREIAIVLRDMEIDIAIDLMGFTQDARVNVLAMRPAPLQVNYLGYSATMGADYIDYIIADKVVLPEDQQQYYSEKIAYLPHSFMVSDATRRISDVTGSRREAGIPENGFVYCSFNNSYKITPDMFDVWMRLLRNTDDSVLWLLEGTPSSSNNLRHEAQKRGVSPERLVFAPRMNPDDHLARHRLADLFLDTLPYNAHTTTSDALWAGLPIVTCLGSAFASRVAGSLLTAIGLPELVTQSLEEYEALALRVAHDQTLLASIKSKLELNRATHPLFDTARSARDIESAYTTMWERFQSGLSPITFSADSRN